LRTFLRGGRFSFTSSLESTDSASESSLGLPSSGERGELDADGCVGEVRRNLGIRI
jgi:hypothetical protein